MPENNPNGDGNSTTQSFPASHEFTDPSSVQEITIENAEPVKTKTPTRTFGKVITEKKTEVAKKTQDNKDNPEYVQAMNNLEDITKQIEQEKAGQLQSDIKIGKLLVEAKNLLVKWGGWYKYLDKIKISPDKAQALMRLANGYANAIPETFQQIQSTGKAIALLTIPDPKEREKFMAANHNVIKSGVSQSLPFSKLSVRDVKKLIDNRSPKKKATNDNTNKTGDEVVKLNFPKKEYDRLFKGVKSEKAAIEEILAAVQYYRSNKGGNVSK